MKLLRFLIIGILGIIVLSSGCIKEEGGALLIDLGNQTLTIPINQTNSTTPSPTNTPKVYTYERKIEVGYELLIKELNLTIRPDFEIRKNQFAFFVTHNGETKVYYEPMDITIDNVKIHGESYWVGTSLYIAQIKIESPRELTILAKEVKQ